MLNSRLAVIILEGSNILLIHRVKKGEEYYVISDGAVEKGGTTSKRVLVVI